MLINKESADTSKEIMKVVGLSWENENIKIDMKGVIQISDKMMKSGDSH